MGPLPGVRGRLPRPSRGSGAPGRALPRWAPSRVSGEASQDVPGVRGPGSGGPSHPPGCPSPKGPGPGVRRARGVLPGRPGGSGAPARVSGGCFPGPPGGQGPRVGPCPDGPPPGCPGRLPRPSRGSGAPGRALPRWAPSRVSGEASQAVAGVRGPGPGVRGPGSGPAPMGPVPGVRGGFPGRPGGQGPRVGPCPEGPRPRCPGPRVGPCPDGPPPGCPGRLPRPSRGSGAPGRALPSSSLPCPDGPRVGRAGPPSLPCPDGPRPVPRGPRRLRELRQSASRWPPSEPGHLASPRTRGIWSPSALICYGASRWPGCPGSPDEGSFAPSCPARAPGGRVRSRRRSPPSPGAHQLPGRAQIFLRITRDRVRRTPSWSGGPVVLDRAPRARVARPPPRTLVRRVSPPKLAAQRADCRPGSSQHRTPIDWAHLVRLGMDCLASLGCCFKQRASNPARDRPTRGPAVSRKALPGRAKAKQPGSLRPPSGPTRVERGRVAPGPGNPPPHGGPGTRVPSPASSSTQRIFPSSSERPFRGASPPVPAGRHPLRPPLRLRLGPAAYTPRRRPVPAGSREPAEGSLTAERPERPRAPARKPSAASQNATPLRHRARPSPWRIPGWRSGPRPPGRPGERTGRGCGLLRPGGPDPLAREGPGSGRGARARASPAPDPPGAARRKSQAPPETEPTPTRHDPGRVNRIVVPPWAWTTPESPAVPGRQGGLGEEEPGPAREPRLHPTRAGGWASPGRLARLGAARLGTGDSRPRRADGRRAGGAETPPRCQVPWPVDRAEGFEDSRGSSRSSGRDRRRRGCPGPEPPRETHPSPAWWGGKLPGRAPGNVLGIVEADSQEGKPDGVPGRHAARSADGRRRLPPASPAPAGGRTLRKVACDSWRWITRLARR
ncbi:hypothetical protein NDU88_006755 [Pleurodeles waltl]|uniref:Basic proline-rich protein-like n=1 Tax=Pleurodeles waltl TaxID=8319 RepID=A0AAV7LQ26_PLEWA|nr:hypothetical protein NDU88_006755 [Pleurodeles waltl]